MMLIRLFVLLILFFNSAFTLAAETDVCIDALLSSAQILDNTRTQAEEFRILSPRLSERITIRLFHRKLEKEVLRQCEEQGGCSASQVAEITEQQIDGYLAKTHKIEHQVRVLGGAFVIIGAMIATAKVGGVLKDNLDSAHQWISDYLITPFMWLGILKFARPIWRNLEDGMETAGNRIFTGDDLRILDRSEEAREAEAIVNEQRNHFSENQTKAITLMHSALSRIESTSRESLGQFRSGHKAQASAYFALTTLVLRRKFSYLKADDEYFTMAVNTHFARWVTTEEKQEFATMVWNELKLIDNRFEEPRIRAYYLKALRSWFGADLRTL